MARLVASKSTVLGLLDKTVSSRMLKPANAVNAIHPKLQNMYPVCTKVLRARVQEPMI